METACCEIHHKRRKPSFNLHRYIVYTEDDHSPLCSGEMVQISLRSGAPWCKNWKCVEKDVQYLDEKIHWIRSQPVSEQGRSLGYPWRTVHSSRKWATRAKVEHQDESSRSEDQEEPQQEKWIRSWWWPHMQEHQECRRQIRLLFKLLSYGGLKGGVLWSEWHPIAAFYRSTVGSYDMKLLHV